VRSFAPTCRSRNGNLIEILLRPDEKKRRDEWLKSFTFASKIFKKDITMTVTAEIETKQATGRRIVRNVERYNRVLLNYPLPNGVGATGGYTLEESYNRGLNKLSEHYGVDFKTI
jgi:hypothetical protein